MPPVGDAYIDVRARGDKLVADARTAGRQAGEQAGDELAKGFAVTAAAAAASQAIFSFLGDSVKEATALGESMSKTTTVFGESAGEIHSWAEGAASDFGLSRLGAEDAAGSFGNMFTQLGFAGDAAADMSTDMVELAADFASFHNADITEVIQAQTAAFRGEYDAVQRFVPTINAAAVEQEGLRLGLADTTKELTAQDKALATNSLLMTGAGAAAGDFDRTSGSLANRQRILQASMADMRAEIGEGLIPVMQVGVTVVGTMVEGFTSLPGPVQTGVVALGGFAAAGVAVGKGIETVKEAFSTFSSVADVARAKVVAKTAATVADTAATVAGTGADGAAALSSFAAANATTIQAVSSQALARAEAQAAAAGTALAASNVAVGTTGAAAGVGINAMLGPLGLITIGIGAVVAGFAVFNQGKDRAKEATEGLTQALYDETGALNTAADAMSNYIGQQSLFNSDNQIDDLQRMNLTFGDLEDRLNAGAEGLAQFEQEVLRSGEVTRVTADSLGYYRDEQGRMIAANKTLTLSTGEVVTGNTQLIKNFETTADASRELAEENSKLLVTNDKVSKSALDAAIAANTAADGQTDWVQVSRDLAVVMKEEAAAADQSASSTAGAARSYILAKDAAYDAITGIEYLADAMDRANSQTFEGIRSSSAFAKATDFSTKAVKSGGGAARDAAKDAERLEDAQRKVADAEAELADAILKRFLLQLGPNQNAVKIAEIEARQAKRDLIDATDEARDAQEKLVAAQKDATPIAVAEAVAAAERDVARAGRDAERAALAVRDAQDKLNEARESGDPDAVRDAELDLADAQDAAKDAADRHREAGDNLKDAQALGIERTAEVDQAARDLEAAQDDVALATMDAEQADKDLADTRIAGQPGTKEWEQANRDVESAQRAVDEAVRAVRDAEDAMNSARTGGGGTIETSLTVTEKLLEVEEAGRKWIQSLLDHKAPADEVNAAMDTIRRRMEEITAGEPEAERLMKQYFDTIEEASGRSADAIQRVIDKGYELQVLLSLDPALAAAGGVTPSAPIPARAKGGMANGLTLVGELGPELVEFGGQAAVFPHDKLMDALGQTRGGDTVVVNIGSVQGSEMQAKRVATLTGAAVARVMAGRHLAVDVRSNR